jgi:hypothetical protein
VPPSQLYREERHCRTTTTAFIVARDDRLFCLSFRRRPESAGRPIHRAFAMSGTSSQSDDRFLFVIPAQAGICFPHPMLKLVISTEA